MDYLLQQPQTYEESFALELPVDYRQHSTEIPLPAIASGYYALLISDNSQFDPAQGLVSFADFWVTDIALLMRNRSDYSEYELFIHQRSEGTALAQAEVNLYDQQYNASTRSYEFKLVETLMADAAGYLKIAYRGEIHNVSSLKS